LYAVQLVYSIGTRLLQIHKSYRVVYKRPQSLWIRFCVFVVSRALCLCGNHSTVILKHNGTRFFCDCLIILSYLRRLQRRSFLSICFHCQPSTGVDCSGQLPNALLSLGFNAFHAYVKARIYALFAIFIFFIYIFSASSATLTHSTGQVFLYDHHICSTEGCSVPRRGLLHCRALEWP
jgi:hypothetical protein